MKIVLATLCFSLFPISSGALRRVDGPVPVLHSVFDRDTPEQAAPPGNYIGGDDGWSRRISAGPARAPEFIRNSRTSPGQMRRTGIGLMIAGGCGAAAGGALLLYANAESARQQANGGRSYVLIPYLLGFMLLLIGSILTLVGFPIWLTHIK